MLLRTLTAHVVALECAVRVLRPDLLIHANSSHDVLATVRTFIDWIDTHDARTL
jgi:hypothetical protein